MNKRPTELTEGEYNEYTQPWDSRHILIITREYGMLTAWVTNKDDVNVEDAQQVFNLYMGDAALDSMHDELVSNGTQVKGRHRE